MKRKTIIVAFILCVVFILSGCSLIDSIFDPLPDKYVDGLKVPRTLPDELELYDDAIVYDADDDESVDLSYGVSVDLDEIIDFYEDLFDDNELEIFESDDSDDEFYATGKGEGFTFEVEAETPTSGYKERAFETIVTLEINFETTSAVETTDTTDKKTLRKMKGFWIVVGMDGDLDESYKADGYGVEITESHIVFYSYFELSIDETPFSLNEGILEYSLDDDTQTYDLTFEVTGGKEYMKWAQESNTAYFLKISYDEFILYGDSLNDYEPEYNIITIEQELTDDQLAEFISGVKWHELHYINADGTTEDMSANSVTFDLGTMTGVDTYEESFDFAWSIDNGEIFFDYVSNDEQDDDPYQMDYSFDGTYGYLYLYDAWEGGGSAWVYITE